MSSNYLHKLNYSMKHSVPFYNESIEYSVNRLHPKSDEFDDPTTVM